MGFNREIVVNALVVSQLAVVMGYNMPCLSILKKYKWYQTVLLAGSCSTYPSQASLVNSVGPYRL